MNNIKQLLREGLINETTVSYHLFDRLKDRLSKLTNFEISDTARMYLDKYLEIITRLNFKLDSSFAIKLADLDINEKSRMYLNINGREYYRINDFLGYDSTGNEIWAIIRNNNIITVMLRKDIQPLAKLGVEYVVNGIGDLQKLIQNNLVK